jgi:hypothetical protein
MPKLRTLSDKDLLRIFAGLGFDEVCHIKLRRILPSGTRQILTIVRHDEVDRGTSGSDAGSAWRTCLRSPKSPA